MLDPRRILRLTRWAIVALAVALAFWIHDNYLIFKPSGPVTGIWQISGDRALLVERAEVGVLPARDRIVLFIDGRGERRLARVLGLPHDPLGDEDGQVTVNGRPTVLPARGEVREDVPAGHLLLAPDDPTQAASFGPPLVPEQRLVGVVLGELPF
ncbi:MAG: hypothetical protein AB1486_19095 [Planctomycetota bacterium]